MNLGRAALVATLLASGITGVLVVACGRPELPIVVFRSRVGLRSDIQPGERLPLKHVATREYAGAKPGFYALRSKYEFEVFRSDLPRPRATPPNDVDWGQEMLIAGYSADADMDKLSIDAIVDTGQAGLHVYATQYSSGEGCPAPQPGAAFDMVALPKSEKPINVHLDTSRAPACKNVEPKAHPVCRIVGTATWQTALTAPWQSNVECEVQSEPGARPVVDRNWFIGEAAKGSTTRLTLSRGNTRATFPLDALGHYAIKLETFDDQGTRAENVATVESQPASDDTFVQFGWSQFTSTDDLSTFPRLDMRIGEVAGPKGSGFKSVCTAQGQRQSWCEVTTSPSVTVMRVADSPGRYGVAVHYLDDRYKGMPVACVRLFHGQALTGEMCDDTPRRAGDTWEPGIIVASAGMFESQMPPPDAGPEGGASDASATHEAMDAGHKPAAADAGPKKAPAATTSGDAGAKAAPKK